jgi:hypothetical protein
MIYMRVEWLHDEPGDPVLLFSEIGEDGYETRKVEVFRDGAMTYADEESSTGQTWLGEAPVPPIEEIAANTEFRPHAITRDEFEEIWDRAHHASTGE